MLSPIYSVISPSKIPAVEAAIKQTIHQPITRATLLSGGFSEAVVFSISTTTGGYLLKLLPQTCSENATIFLNYKLAAGACIAPHLHYADDEHGILMTDYIESQPIDKVFTPEQAITQLADRIKRLHQIEPPLQIEKTDLRATFDQAMEWFTNRGFFTAGHPAFSIYTSIKKAYPWHDNDKVLSHNDLNPRNVLCDGKQLLFVDWDASSVSDRYVDLAIAANFFAHSPALQNSLLHTYFGGEPTGYQVARFNVMKTLCRLVYAEKILQLALSAQPADAPYNRDPNETNLATVGALLKSGSLSMNCQQGQWLYGKALLNEALRGINDGAFTAYLAELS